MILAEFSDMPVNFFGCLLLSEAHFSVVILICENVFLCHATAHPPFLLPTQPPFNTRAHTHINNMAQGVISYFRVFVYCMRYMGHQLSQWEWFTLLI